MLAALLPVILLVPGLGAQPPGAGAERGIPWLEANLVRNAGFEEGARGWTARKNGSDVSFAADASVRLAGKNSLRMAVNGSPAGITLSSGPVPVEPGARYLFSVGFRQEGFSLEGKPGRESYAGVSSSSFLRWLDVEKKPAGQDRSVTRFPYGPSNWDIRDGLIQAPANAHYATVVASMSNNSLKHLGQVIPARLWLDAVQFRKYSPPPTPEWAKGKTALVVDGVVDQSPVKSLFPASSDEIRSKGGQWSKIVVDETAERGSALLSPAKSGYGLMGHSPYYPAMPPGLYRVRARVKVTDNRAKERAGFLDILGRFAGIRLFLQIIPAAFRQPGQYQVLEQDFILRDSGWWALRFYTDGRQAWSIDSVKIIPLFQFEDRQLIRIYPGVEGEVEPALRPRAARPTRALFVAGLGYDIYQFPRVLRLLDNQVEIHPVWVRRDRNFHLDGFPETAKELFDYSCILLCNINATAFSLRQKHMLNEYVRRGGALIVLGGQQSYERGRWRGSLLEEALPVIVSGGFSEGLLHDARGLSLSMSSELPWLQEAEVTENVRVFFLHQVQLKEGAQVFARAGGKPFLVGGPFGHGRVLCVLGDPFGTSGKFQPFWAWPDWPYLLRNAIWWAMKR